MFGFTLVGWMLFRATSIEWIWTNLSYSNLVVEEQSIVASIHILRKFLIYIFPLFVFFVVEKISKKSLILQNISLGILTVYMTIFACSEQIPFIYFQF